MIQIETTDNANKCVTDINSNLVEMGVADEVSASSDATSLVSTLNNVFDGMHSLIIPST